MTRRYRFRVWFWRILMVGLLFALLFSIYISDADGILTILAALLIIGVCWYPLEWTERKPGIGQAAIIRQKLRRSDDPSKEFNQIINKMIRRRYPSKEIVTGILEYFSKQEDDVGREARDILLFVDQYYETQSDA